MNNCQLLFRVFSDVFVALTNASFLPLKQKILWHPGQVNVKSGLSKLIGC